MVYTRITIIRSVVYIFYYMYEGTVRRYRCTWTRAEYRVPGTRTVFEVFFLKSLFYRLVTISVVIFVLHLHELHSMFRLYLLKVLVCLKTLIVVVVFRINFSGIIIIFDIFFFNVA
jgi:hypothetical protein